MTTVWDRLSSTAIRQYLMDTHLVDTQGMTALKQKKKNAEWREAAVLVPLLRADDQWHLLFIRRPESESDYHSGQVAFPGGRREAYDVDLTQTALREAQEEIGLDENKVQILGQLGTHFSGSGYSITPIVAHIRWPYPLKPNPLEVARTFTIPVSWLAEDQHHEYRFWQSKQDSAARPVAIPYFQEFDGELLWGATARITLSLLNILRPHLPNLKV